MQDAQDHLEREFLDKEFQAEQELRHQHSLSPFDGALADDCGSGAAAAAEAAAAPAAAAGDVPADPSEADGAAAAAAATLQ